MTGAGDLQERLRFEQKGLDDNGDRLGPWDAANGIERSARVFFRMGTEPVIQQRLQGLQPAEITIRADSQSRRITNAWRAVDTRSERIFNLKAVTPSEDRAWITLLGVVGDGDA